MTLMSRLRLGADCEVLVLVAEGDLLLAPAAPMLSFVRTLLGLAVSGMADDLLLALLRLND